MISRNNILIILALLLFSSCAYVSIGGRYSNPETIPNTQDLPKEGEEPFYAPYETSSLPPHGNAKQKEAIRQDAYGVPLIQIKPNNS